MSKTKLPFSDSVSWKSSFNLREGKAPPSCSFPASNTMATLPSWFAQPFGVQPQAHQVHSSQKQQVPFSPSPAPLLWHPTSLCTLIPAQVNWHHTYHFRCAWYLLFLLALGFVFINTMNQEKKNPSATQWNLIYLFYTISMWVVCLWKLLVFDVIPGSNQTQFCIYSCSISTVILTAC